jgi:thioredoxin 1
MPPIQATDATFDQLVATNGIVLVDFWASWCGPCRMFAPVFAAAAEEHPDMTFVKVDTEAEQQLAARFGIMSIPTLMVFRDQVLVFAQPGALPAPALAQLIEAVQALDMDEVRRTLAAQSGDTDAAPDDDRDAEHSDTADDTDLEYVEVDIVEEDDGSVDVTTVSVASGVS